jgi:WD40 repeat protein
MLMRLESSHGQTWSIKWSPDGSWIATGHGDGAIIIWDAVTGTEVRALLGHNDRVKDLTWSSDGARIVAGDNDGLVKVWDMETGAEVLGFTVPGGVETALWSPDGSQIMVAGHFPEPVIRRAWSSTQALIDYAYECCVTRQLTPEERQQFGLPPREE